MTNQTVTYQAMTCTDCGKVKAWHDGFPNTLDATCWQCVWNAHCRDEHPLPRKQRRRLRKLARKLAHSQLVTNAESAMAVARLVGEQVKNAS